MEKLLSWIIKHKTTTIIVIVLLFVTPLIFIHFLFMFKTDNPLLAAKWTPGDLMAYIAGFEAFIGTVALGALALWQNQQIHKQHIESLEPTLSMRLIPRDGILFLVVENTGECEATEIRIQVESLSNNGDQNLLLGQLFENTFELYPHEIVQSHIAVSGANITTEIFPMLTVSVSYLRPDINRRRKYTRTVIYDDGYKEKINVDANVDTRDLQNAAKTIARASVRIANYLDGHQVSSIDELSILSGRSLQNDLASVNGAKEDPIIKRDQIIGRLSTPVSNQEGKSDDAKDERPLHEYRAGEYK